jgi:hypothetical protein
MEANTTCGRWVRQVLIKRLIPGQPALVSNPIRVGKTAVTPATQFPKRPFSALPIADAGHWPMLVERVSSPANSTHRAAAGHAREVGTVWRNFQQWSLPNIINHVVAIVEALSGAMFVNISNQTNNAIFKGISAFVREPTSR